MCSSALGRESREDDFTFGFLFVCSFVFVCFFAAFSVNSHIQCEREGIKGTEKGKFLSFLDPST